MSDTTDDDKVIANLTRKLVRLEEENAALLLASEKREDWLRTAKSDAGFHVHTSFDVVWEHALKAYKASLNQAAPV